MYVTFSQKNSQQRSYYNLCRARSQFPGNLPYYSKCWQLLQIKGEIHTEVCSEQGCDGNCERRKVEEERK